MAVQIFANNVFTTLQGAIVAGDTAITVPLSDAARFPSPSAGDWFLATIEDNVNLEIVKCTARATNVLTVVRNQEGTGAYAFPNGARIDMRVTAGSLAQFAPSAALAAYVLGPAVALSTNNALVRWDLASGRLVKNSTATLDDSGNLAVAGFTAAGPLVVGHTAQLAVANTDNTQIIGATVATAGLGLLSFINGGQAHIDFYSAPSGTIGTYAPVLNGGALGGLNWYGAQQTGAGANWSRAAQIRAEVDGVVTDGTGADMPGRIIFSTSPDGSATIAERMRIDKDGLITIAAGQIKFPASQNPSANANTFDDYSEFTFTPRIDGTTAAGAGTYSVQTGSGTKLGRHVNYDAQLVWSAHTGTGNMVIAGLPFTSAATFTWPCALVPSNLTAANPLYGKVTAAATTIQLGTAASAAAFTALAIDTAAAIDASGHYHV